MARKKILEGIQKNQKNEKEPSAAATTNGSESNDLVNVSTEEYTTEVLGNQEVSEVSTKEKRPPKDGRTRTYAFVVYPDSAYEDWQERLTQEHVAALISPLHDRDENPDGTAKKAHWHVMIMYDGKKSLKQVNELRERVIGPDYNKGMENVASMRGYARYLVHADNPEKAQYDRADVRAMGGADYDAIATMARDDDDAIGEMMEYIRRNRVRYYSDFMMICKRNNPEWFHLLVSRKSYTIIEFIKSEAVKARDAMMAEDTEYGRTTRKWRPSRRRLNAVRRYETVGVGVGIDPETGEILEPKEGDE